MRVNTILPLLLIIRDENLAEGGMPSARGPVEEEQSDLFRLASTFEKPLEFTFKAVPLHQQTTPCAE